MTGLKQFAVLVVVALVALLAVAGAMGAYGAIDSAADANPLFGPSDSFMLGFVGTLWFGVPIVVVIGAPAYFILLQQGLARWPYILLASAVPGFIVWCVSEELGFWAILCGVAVASLTHVVYRWVGTNKPLAAHSPARVK
jgi:hypothetical protein